MFCLLFRLQFYRNPPPYPQQKVYKNIADDFYRNFRKKHVILLEESRVPHKLTFSLIWFSSNFKKNYCGDEMSTFCTRFWVSLREVFEK